VLKYLMDQHVPIAIVDGLRLRGVDALTAYEDGSSTLNDSLLLDRATTLGRILFTSDDDLLNEAAKRQRDSVEFSGVIFVRGMSLSIGACISDLEVIAKAGMPEDLRQQVIYLPLP
jgi:hypothetical protein